jgi:C1A family cysteine protease
MKFRLNLQKSSLDKRDYRLSVQTLRSSTPQQFSLESFCPPVFDQGSIGSCTAQSSACMYSCIYKQKTRQVFLPARLYIYYNTRLIENSVSADNGATLRNTMKAMVKNGVCTESIWPYQNNRLYLRPTNNCYVEGMDRQVLSYASVPIQLQIMKNLLLSQHSFVMGILVFPSFFSGGGQVPIPNPNVEPILGGHAICIIGYDDQRQAFLARNSWGSGWGIRGNFYIPYAYATNRNLAFDAWVLYNVEIPSFRIKKPFAK